MQSTPFGLVFFGTILCAASGVALFKLEASPQAYSILFWLVVFGFALIIGGILWVRHLSPERRKSLRKASRAFRFLFWPFGDVAELEDQDKSTDRK